MPNIYRVRAPSTGWTGGPGLNTFYFRQGSGELGGDAGDAQLCADRVRTAFFDAMVLFPTEWTMQVDPTVDYLDDATGDLVSSYVVTPPELVVGGGTSGFGPIAAMFLLQLRTSVVIEGRRLRGRAFIGPVKPGSDANGSPTADDLGLLAAIGAALLDVGVAGPALVIWHRPRLADPAATPPVTASSGSSGIVDAITTPDYFAVLRSRRD